MNWVDAGKVELEQGSSYFGLSIPFDLTTLCILEALLVGFVEVQRNTGEPSPLHGHRISGTTHFHAFPLCGISRTAPLPRPSLPNLATGY